MLWNKFSSNLCDDLKLEIKDTYKIPKPTELQVTDYGLYLLEKLLLEEDKMLADFKPMPKIVENWSEHIKNRLIWEQEHLNHVGQHMEFLANVVRLNEEQRKAYDAVINSVENDKGSLLFLNGATDWFSNMQGKECVEVSGVMRHFCFSYVTVTRTIGEMNLKINIGLALYCLKMKEFCTVDISGVLSIFRTSIFTPSLISLRATISSRLIPGNLE
ncbi:hypothetical protein GIB67_009689 [Kingdonia uniflora]|uniref:Uncharacterized protein n=1 Tax=Kingdonia uniflora TaxID=39325 RepID=A0A7J7LBC0_9MAGN|nr:hypothetical protein GIB67_009689 [Kingdonia uniflora]